MLTGRLRLVAAAGCAIVALYLTLAAVDAGRVNRANRLGSEGDYRGALREADRVTRAPSDAAALLVRARAWTRLGDLRRADRAWGAAVARMPNDWKLQLEWFRALVFLGGDGAHARRVYARARALNPRLPTLSGA